MDITTSGFFYFSTEGYSRGLPCKAKFMKRLKAKNDREVILIECDQLIPDYRTKHLVLVPRLQNTSFFDLDSDGQVFANVLSGGAYLEKEYIDLSPGNKLLIDIGGIAFSEEVAKKWQVSKAEAAESDKFVRQKFSGKPK